MKKKSISKEVEAAAVLLQKLVRMKAADESGYCACVTCGAVKLWNDGMQGGHFIDRGHMATKLLEENIHPQCAYCNSKFSNQGIVKAKYTIYMQEMYGEDFVNDLLLTKGQTKKYYRAEIDEIKADFKQRIKQEEERVGIRC